MLARIFLFLNCFIFSVFINTSAHAATFLESDGTVVFEAESASATGQWSRSNNIGGSKGGGYLIWNGPDLFSGQNAGRDTLRYTFRIQQAGNYEMRWRSYIGHGNNSTEANDSWVRFPTGKNIAGQHALNGWTKAYQNQLNQWSWSAVTVDHVGKSIRQYFSKGDHVMEISGRSNGHAVDRVVLFRYADVRYSSNAFDALGVSSTVGGSQPADATPEPAPTPAPAPEPTPEPKPEPAVEPEPVAQATAPAVSVSGNTLSWNAVEASAINVHNADDGAWLKSLPGSATRWQAPSSGEYFVVATNKGSWETWGRSNVVTVTVASSSDAEFADDINSPSENAIIATLTSSVYSRTSAEIFWTVSSAPQNAQFEVKRNGEVVFTGLAASYYDNSLAEGASYEYRLAVIDNGQVVDESKISLVTMGDATQGASDAGAQSTSDNTQSSNTANFIGTVYSRTALELMWDRSTSGDAESYLYNIYQDDVLVASSNATSYFADGLNEGQTYTYTLRIQDAAGVEGDALSIALTTFSDGESVMALTQTKAEACDACATFGLQLLQSDGEVVRATDLFSDVYWYGQSSSQIETSSMQVARSLSGESIYVSAQTVSDAINADEQLVSDGVSIVEIDAKTGARVGTHFSAVSK